MRKFNGNSSCCECGHCDQYKQQCGSDFVYNTSSIAIYNMTNRWYYDTYTWKNWYTAPDENTWVSNDYLGYTRIPASGYNDNYWDDYNVPAGAPTKKEWTETDIIGAYYDEGYVRVLNGGFEDGGAFHYDEATELYYRIFQDSADHIDTFVTMQSSATWDLSSLWWWEIDKNARRSAIKVTGPASPTSDNHTVKTTASGPIEVKTRLTEYGLTGIQSPTIYATMSDGVWDVATPAATMDDWDTQTTALDFDFELSQATQYITNAVSGYGTGTSPGDNLTFYFGLNDPTGVASNRSEAYSTSELWFDSGADLYTNAGDGSLPQEWWPVNDTPGFGNPYNHINGDNLDVPTDELSMTIPKAIGINGTMLISTQFTSMFCNDTATPIVRNAKIELLDTSLADTDPNYVFKTIDLDVKTVLKDGVSHNIGYATMDGKTFMLYEKLLGDASFDPDFIRLRYSDGLIGLQMTEGTKWYFYVTTPGYYSISSRPQYSSYDPTFNSVSGWHEYSVGWAEWIETGVTYPSSIKIRVSHPNGDKVDTFCGWATTKINTNNCQDMGCPVLSDNRTLVTRVAIDSLLYGVNSAYNGVTYSTVSTANLDMTEQHATSDNTSPCYLDDPGGSALRSTWCSCTQHLDGAVPVAAYPPTESPFWSFQTVLVSGTETNATVRVFVCPTEHYQNLNTHNTCDGDIIYVYDGAWGGATRPIYVYEKSEVDLTSPVSFTVSDIMYDSWGKYKYWDDAQSMDVCDTSYNEYIWKLEFTITTKSGN